MPGLHNPLAAAVAVHSGLVKYQTSHTATPVARAHADWDGPIRRKIAHPLPSAVPHESSAAARHLHAGQLLDEVQDGGVVGILLAVVDERAEHLLHQGGYGQGDVQLAGGL